MNKEEVIKRYGEEAWQKMLAQGREYYKEHKEEKKAYNKKYREEHKEEEKAYQKRYNEEHPEEVKANSTRSSHEQNRKGGKYYDKNLEDKRTGLRGERNRIRNKHAREFREIKDTLAEEVELHHEWIGDTAEYRGVALVEKDAHRNGFIDVILLLDGKITLLTEEEVKGGGKKWMQKKQKQI
ncbi:MAG: hypothetical protein IMF19_12210 [Proteobacteria bacterium]|nr:hypothetical protein [Pseudomonadota bacterium]